MSAAEIDSAIREAIRHWWHLPALAEFAERRHGYGDSNGGFGITYPGDLDDYDRQVNAEFIPEGFVRVYGFWGLPDGYEVLVKEPDYLRVLAEELLTAGCASEGERVKSLLQQEV